MTNSKFDVISGGDFVDIEDKLNISFTSGSEYQIQIINPAYVCEAFNFIAAKTSTNSEAAQTGTQTEE